MIAVLEFFLIVFSCIFGACLLMLGFLAVFDFVPGRISHLPKVMMFEILNIIRVTSPSRTPSISDPVFWYGRGNVLYQNGQALDDTDLRVQRERSESALRHLNATLSWC
jgi:hypothetical protein